MSLEAALNGSDALAALATSDVEAVFVQVVRKPSKLELAIRIGVTLLVVGTFVWLFVWMVKQDQKRKS